MKEAEAKVQTVDTASVVVVSANRPKYSEG